MDMAKLRSIMPQSIIVHVELTENTRNVDAILPSLLDAFRRHFLRVEDEIEER